MQTESMNWTYEQLMKINSMTKYPSIETYHPMLHNGVLEIDKPMDMGTGELQVFEKIDGTNSRIIMMPGEVHQDIMIGSREELLHFETDVLYRPDYGIVKTLRNLVREHNLDHAYDDDKIRVLYFETYGHPSQNKVARNYSTSGHTDARLFDIAVFDFDEWNTVMNWDFEGIASWRDRGGQPFLNYDQFKSEARYLGLLGAPHLAEIESEELPESAEECLEWMNRLLPETWAAIDEDAAKKPEGVIVRNHDRTKISKLRFQNYLRTVDVLSKSG